MVYVNEMIASIICFGAVTAVWKLKGGSKKGCRDNFLSIQPATPILPYIYLASSRLI